MAGRARSRVPEGPRWHALRPPGTHWGSLQAGCAPCPPPAKQRPRASVCPAVRGEGEPAGEGRGSCVQLSLAAACDSETGTRLFLCHPQSSPVSILTSGERKSCGCSAWFYFWVETSPSLLPVWPGVIRASEGSCRRSPWLLAAPAWGLLSAHPSKALEPPAPASPLWGRCLGGTGLCIPVWGSRNRAPHAQQPRATEIYFLLALEAGGSRLLLPRPLWGASSRGGPCVLVCVLVPLPKDSGHIGLGATLLLCGLNESATTIFPNKGTLRSGGQDGVTVQVVAASETPRIDSGGGAGVWGLRGGAGAGSEGWGGVRV